MLKGSEGGREERGGGGWNALDRNVSQVTGNLSQFRQMAFVVVYMHVSSGVISVVEHRTV